VVGTTARNRWASSAVQQWASTSGCPSCRRGLPRTNVATLRVTRPCIWAALSALCTQKRHPKPVTPYKSILTGACARIGPQACLTYGPFHPFLSPSYVAGCPVSGKAASASSCVGWSAGKPCTQGGKPWKNSPAGPRRPSQRGVAAAWCRRALGMCIYGWSGGSTKRATPCRRPRMGTSLWLVTAVTHPSGVDSIPWPKKDGKVHITLGFAGCAWLCESSTGMSSASQWLFV